MQASPLHKKCIPISFNENIHEKTPSVTTTTIIKNYVILNASTVLKSIGIKSSKTPKKYIKVRRIEGSISLKIIRHKTVPLTRRN